MNSITSSSQQENDPLHGLDPESLMEVAALPTDADTLPLAAADWPSQAEIVEAFPDLEIQDLIGHGGMSVVYRARQPKLDRLIALKILPKSLAATPGFSERFTREGRVLARLSHPNIVTVHDFGTSDGFGFLIMEFVDGVNLRQAMRVGRFTPEQALNIIPAICDALQFAHGQGVLHRDIKPENILLDSKGRVKIADFGIAKILNEDAGDAMLLTQSGAKLGTAPYMAPEQIEQPSSVDHRADIYSLGVVLYELLTGELPKANLEAPSRRVQIDVRLDEIVLRALEARPDRRYSTAAEFRTQLATIVSGSVKPAGAVLKSDNSYISTPEHLSTFYGRFAYIYTGKGHLLLDTERLTFTRPNAPAIVIPLFAIRDLSIGPYPATAKPIRLNFISVTFEENGNRRQLLFTPNEGAFTPAWGTNRIVADWFKAIQDATRNATGSIPPSTPEDHLGVPRGSAMKWLPMFAVLLGAVVLACLFATPNLGQTARMMVIPVALLLMVAGPMFVGLLSRPQRETEGQANPGRSWRWAGVLSMILGAVLLLGSQVFNGMVNDFALTAAAREHQVKRDKAVSQAAAMRTEAESKVTERAAVQARLKSATDPEEQGRLRRESEALDRESQRQLAAAKQLDEAIDQANRASERARQQRVLMFYLIAGALLVAGAGALFRRTRGDAESVPARRTGVGCVNLSIMAAAGAVAMIAVLTYQLAGHIGSTPGTLQSVSSQLVSVEGNIVTVELNLQVAEGTVEVRAELNGKPAPDAKRLPLVDSDRNTGQRTLVLPGAPIGNQPWRIFQPGMHLWRLRYVLPTPELAQQAAESLRSMGELPAVAGKGHAGTVFELGNPESPDYHAVLHVSEVMSSTDPRWVSVEGQRSWNESATRATWTVRTNTGGMIHLLHGDGQRDASLQRNATTKFHEASIVVEITKIGSDRVKVATSVGSGTVGGEFGGDYLQVRDELLNTALNTAKLEIGTRVELCRLDGKPLVLEVPVIMEAATGAAAPERSTTAIRGGVTTVNRSWMSFFLPFILSAVVLIVIVTLLRSMRRRGRSGCVAALLIVLALALLLATAALVWYLSRASQVDHPLPAPAQGAKVIEAPRIPT
ncbi:MAG: protein kinase [Verrucomicrobiales bacterium]|nr:protein kinase [Verrucomicrobiales bacterium]